MAKKTFKRYEYKYLLTLEQYNAIMPVILTHLKEDEYPVTTIQSLYFDTPTNLLIRRSIEKPVYKEKIRLRAYGRVDENNFKVFLELKKKYEKVVYKRRIRLPYDEAKAFMRGELDLKESQIAKEITYFTNYYKPLSEHVLLIYDRAAYKQPNTNLRITFDSNIRYRTKDFDLSLPLEGEKLIGDDQVLMEIKADLAIPLWLVKELEKNQIYKRSFSKYGNVYKLMLERGKVNV